MGQCPDKLTIQSFIDGEKVKKSTEKHIQSCNLCQKSCEELKGLIINAGKLKTGATLPEGFWRLVMAEKPKRGAFPISLVIAVLFFATFISAYFLNPGYFQEWLSVGITRFTAMIMDVFFGLTYLSRTLDSGFIIATLTVIVFIEIVLLNKLKIMEGCK